MAKDKKDIQCIEDLLIHHEQGESGGRKIRIAHYLINGKPTRKFLENRMYSVQQGKEFMGKNKGLTMEDLNIIVDKWDELTKAMGGGNGE